MFDPLAQEAAPMKDKTAGLPDGFMEAFSQADDAGKLNLVKEWYKDKAFKSWLTNDKGTESEDMGENPAEEYPSFAAKG